MLLKRHSEVWESMEKWVGHDLKAILNWLKLVYPIRNVIG